MRRGGVSGVTRHVRRPSALHMRIAGGEQDGEVFYDGKTVSLLTNNKKMWAQAHVPPTLDEMMDFVAARLDIPMPMADVLYSNPYESLMTDDTRGSYVGEEPIEGSSCHHLSFQQEALDWQIWICHGRPASSLPSRNRLQTGTRAATVTDHFQQLAPRGAACRYHLRVPAAGGTRQALGSKAAPSQQPTAGSKQTPATMDAKNTQGGSSNKETPSNQAVNTKNVDSQDVGVIKGEDGAVIVGEDGVTTITKDDGDWDVDQKDWDDVEWDQGDYYEDDNAWAFVAGAIITTLPPGCTTTFLNGMTHYICSDSYYMKVTTGHQVVVVH